MEKNGRSKSRERPHKAGVDKRGFRLRHAANCALGKKKGDPFEPPSRFEPVLRLGRHQHRVDCMDHAV